MKTLLRLLLVIVPTLLGGCEWFDKDGDATLRPPKGFDVGKIYGYDMTECLCCGGYMVSINDGDYRFFNEEVNGANPLDTEMQYPFYVYLKWSLKTGDCGTGKRIVVQELRLAKS